MFLIIHLTMVTSESATDASSSSSCPRIPFCVEVAVAVIAAVPLSFNLNWRSQQY